MSPERLDGRAYSFSSDIWALGMIVYEMVVGKSPYPETDKPIHQSENMKTYPSPNFDALDGVSAELKSFIKGMLQMESENRLSADILL